MVRYFQERMGRRLSLAVCVAMSLVSASFIAVVVGSTTASLSTLAASQFDLLDDIVMAALSSGDRRGHFAGIQKIARDVAPFGQIERVRVVSNDGTIRWSVTPGEAGQPISQDVRNRTGDKTNRRPFRSDSGHLETIRPLRNMDACQGCHTEEQAVLGYMHLGLGTEAVGNASWRLTWLLVASSFVLLVLTLGVITLLLRTMVGRPLKKLARAIEQAQGGDLMVRAPVESVDEFGRLAESFNQMLSRLTAMTARELDTARELEAAQKELKLTAEIEEKKTLLEDANRKLAQRVNELSVLFGISQEVSAELHLERLFNALTHIVGDTLGYNEFALLLLDEAAEKLTICATSGFGEAEDVKGVTFKVGEGITGRVAASGEMILIEDTRKDDRFLHYKGKRMVDGCFLALPLKVHERVLGVLSFLRPALEGFSEPEIRFLTSLASQVAIAIDNARLYERVEALSATDELTGLPNRRTFIERLTRELKRADRDSKTTSLAMIDIDYFKHYNDTNGHVEGDGLLRRIAMILGGQVRSVDLVARYGGEEFVVVLPGADQAEALKVAEKLRSRVERTAFDHAETQPGGRLTISVGVATYPADALSPEDLLVRADFALYRAKEFGRNRVLGFDEKMRTAFVKSRTRSVG